MRCLLLRAEGFQQQSLGDAQGSGVIATALQEGCLTLGWVWAKHAWSSIEDRDRVRWGSCWWHSPWGGMVVPALEVLHEQYGAHFTNRENEAQEGPRSGLERGFKEVSRKYLDLYPAM